MTPGGYYTWRRRPISAHAEQDRTLTVAITRGFTRHHGRYGSPRIHQLLVADGHVVSRRRVARPNQVWVGDITYLPVAG